MKRSIKNTIMIGMAAVLIGTSAITFAYAGTQNRTMATPPGFSQSFGGSDSSDGFNKQFPGGDNQQPPEFPNGDSSQQPQMPPGDNSQDSQQNENAQPPAQSEDSTKSSSQTSLSTDNSNTADAATTETAKDFPKQMKSQSKLVSTVCYVFLAVQIAILLSILAYLIISKMNKVSFSQLFPEKSKE